MDRQTDRYTDTQTDRWVDGWTDRQVGGWAGGRAGGWTDGHQQDQQLPPISPDKVFLAVQGGLQTVGPAVQGGLCRL